MFAYYETNYVLNWSKCFV